MRIDSCRKCGEELVPCLKCEVCKETIAFRCKNCEIETEEKIHVTCKLIELEYRLLNARGA